MNDDRDRDRAEAARAIRAELEASVRQSLGDDYSQERFAAVLAHATAQLERELPGLRHDRVLDGLASLGLGKRR